MTHNTKEGQSLLDLAKGQSLGLGSMTTILNTNAHLRSSLQDLVDGEAVALANAGDLPSTEEYVHEQSKDFRAEDFETGEFS